MLNVPTYVAASNIHGLGVFADGPIKKGEIVWTMEPKLDLSFEDFGDMPGWQAVQLRNYSFKGMAGTFIVCFDNARFMNFPEPGDEANTKLGMTVNGEHQLIAAHDIPAGYEITVSLESDNDARWKLEE